MDTLDTLPVHKHHQKFLKFRFKELCIIIIRANLMAYPVHPEYLPNYSNQHMQPYGGWVI